MIIINYTPSYYNMQDYTLHTVFELEKVKNKKVLEDLNKLASLFTMIKLNLARRRFTPHIPPPKLIFSEKLLR